MKGNNHEPIQTRFMSRLAIYRYLEVSNLHPGSHRKIDWCHPGLCVPDRWRHPLRNGCSFTPGHTVRFVWIAPDYQMPFLRSPA